MHTMNREELIEKIVSSRVQDVLVPSTVFGMPMLVKTTKKDIVNRIRETYAENSPTNLKFRIRPRTNTAVVQPVLDFSELKNLTKDAKPVEQKAEKRGRGRPKGSKNKPKVQNNELIAA